MRGVTIAAMFSAKHKTLWRDIVMNG